jgi:hypothetical protein
MEEEKKFDPFWRHARLQLIFLLGEKRILADWVNGILLPVEQGESSITINYYVGLSEFDDMGFCAHLLKHGFTDINYDPITRLMRNHATVGINRIWIRSSKRNEIENRLCTAAPMNIYGFEV